MASISPQFNGLTTGVGVTNVGVAPETVDAPMKIRGAARVAGDIVMLDCRASDASTTKAAFYDPNSLFANVVSATATTETGLSCPAIFLVVLEDTALGGTGLCRLCGIADANVGGTNALAIGTPLGLRRITASSTTLVTDGDSGNAILAIGCVAVADVTTAAPHSVWFSGLHRIFGLLA